MNKNVQVQNFRLYGWYDYYCTYITLQISVVLNFYISWFSFVILKGTFHDKNSRLLNIWSQKFATITLNSSLQHLHNLLSNAFSVVNVLNGSFTAVVYIVWSKVKNELLTNHWCCLWKRMDHVMVPTVFHWLAPTFENRLENTRNINFNSK